MVHFRSVKPAYITYRLHIKCIAVWCQDACCFETTPVNCLRLLQWQYRYAVLSLQLCAAGLSFFAHWRRRWQAARRLSRISRDNLLCIAFVSFRAISSVYSVQRRNTGDIHRNEDEKRYDLYRERTVKITFRSVANDNNTRHTGDDQSTVFNRRT